MNRCDGKRALGHRFFTPKSIALIGVSADESAFGTLYLQSLLKFGFKGKLYPVNPRRGSIFGLALFSSVREIPGNVDLAIISVPKRAVPGALEDCVAKGIQAAVVLSAGFSETGEEGKRLEEEMVRVSAKGIRIIGPNCFGLYCPRGGLTIIPGKDFPKESGPIGLLTQSGQIAEMIVQASGGLGIRFSKVASYGNACDLNEADLVELLADDPETRIISCYIEGVKQGRRFLEVVRRTLKQKPVLIWKAGLTDSGRRAAGSHTGSLAGSEAMWNTFFKQSGAIQIGSMEELIDSMVAFTHLLPGCGRRIGLLGGSGGSGVIGADVCERCGLKLPAFSAGGQQKISSHLPPMIAGVRNPVDLGNPIPSAEVLVPVLEAVAGEKRIDTILMGGIQLSVKGPGLAFGLPKSFEKGREGLREIPVRIKEKYGKPVLMVLNEERSDAGPIGIEFEADRRDLRDYYLANGIPVYPTLGRAAKALANVLKYITRAK